MNAIALHPEDLHVESFATESRPRGAGADALAITQNPMDCPETLPRFCAPTSLC